MSWVLKRAQRIFSRTISGHRLLEDGEPVVVGVSGGADSLCLVHLMNEHNLKRSKGWQIHAVHVDPGYPGWNSARVVRACERIGLPCAVRKACISYAGRLGKDSCYSCARERRKELFKAADELGCRKVALAHHMEDVNETFLLNLLYTSSAATILPMQSLFKGRLFIIRPLYNMDKELILRCLKQAGLKPVRNRCPFEKTSTRGVVRRFLAKLYRENPRIKTNLFWGMQNLKPDYLPGFRKL